MKDRGEESFLREPLRAFHDLRKEDFCRARAQGMNPTKASEEAGIHRNLGAEWNRRAEIIARVREIRQSTEGYTEVSTAYVLEELKVTVSEARQAGQYKAAIDGLKALHDIISRDKSGMRAAALGVTAASLANVSQQRKALHAELSRPEPRQLPIDTTAEEEDPDGDSAA